MYLVYDLIRVLMLVINPLAAILLGTYPGHYTPKKKKFETFNIFVYLEFFFSCFTITGFCFLFFPCLFYWGLSLVIQNSLLINHNICSIKVFIGDSFWELH